MKYATAMRTTIATMMVAGLIDIPPLRISKLAIISCESNLSGPLGHLPYEGRQATNIIRYGRGCFKA
jgi:hypothetical protein